MSITCFFFYIKCGSSLFACSHLQGTLYNSTYLFIYFKQKKIINQKEKITKRKMEYINKKNKDMRIKPKLCVKQIINYL